MQHIDLDAPEVHSETALALGRLVDELFALSALLELARNTPGTAAAIDRCTDQHDRCRRAAAQLLRIEYHKAGDQALH